MPASSSFQLRQQSDVQTSTLLASDTASIGSRAQGFPARVTQSSVIGGDFTATAVVIDHATLILFKDQTFQLHATATTADGTAVADDVDAWASSDETVATVSAAGLVTVVGAGTTNITASSGAIDSAACAVTVTAALGQLILADSTLSFAHTTTGTTTVTAKDQFGNSMTLPSGVAVASSDVTKATVAIVTGTITVTGVAAGTTNVTASKSGITSNVCAVTLS